MSSAKVPISHMTVQVTQRSQITPYQHAQKESAQFLFPSALFLKRKAVKFSRITLLPLAKNMTKVAKMLKTNT